MTKISTLTDMDARPRVFISYSRKDIVAAEQLRAELQAQRFEAYIDKHDILPGEPWQERLGKLIETADTIVFLISPDSIESAICDWEVNEAERLTKRVLPVVIRQVVDSKVPGRLRRLNYIFLQDDTQRATELAKLVAALLLDIGWLREHTRLGELAARWEASQRPVAQLLRGDDITSANSWAVRRPRSAPALTPTIISFVETSRTEAISEQSREAVRRRLLALEGLPDRNAPQLTPRIRPFVPETEFALDFSRRRQSERAILLGHGGSIGSAVFSPDGLRVLTASEDKSAVIWDARSGAQLSKLLGHTGYLLNAMFSADGERAITSSSDRTWRIWDAGTGKQLRAFEHPGDISVLS